MAQGFLLCDFEDGGNEPPTSCGFSLPHLGNGFRLPDFDSDTLPASLEQPPSLLIGSNHGFDLPTLEEDRPPMAADSNVPAPFSASLSAQSASRPTQNGPADFFNVSDLLDSAVARLGREKVRKQLSSALYVGSLFSGVGGGEAAVECLAAAVSNKFGTGHMPVKFGISADFSSTSQRFLRAAFPTRCIFGDINQWPELESADSPSAPCCQHKSQCPLLPPEACRETKMLIFGGPCVAHTRMGSRKKFADPRTDCHFKARCYAKRAKYDLLFSENVLQFPMGEFLSDFEDEYEVKVGNLDPRSMGWPMARERQFGIAVRRDWGMWTEEDPWSFLLSLMPGMAQGSTAESFFQSSIEASPPLSVSMSNRVDQYGEVFGRTSSRLLVWDVTQNPAKRPRTNRTDGSLQTLLRRSRLYAPQFGVLLNGDDALTAMGFPVLDVFARSCQVSRWSDAFASCAMTDSNLPSLSCFFFKAVYIKLPHLCWFLNLQCCLLRASWPGQKIDLAGNALHVPTLAGAILMTLLCTQPREFWYGLLIARLGNKLWTVVSAVVRFQFSTCRNGVTYDLQAISDTQTAWLDFFPTPTCGSKFSARVLQHPA